jgi:hypothetical protein
MQDTRCSLRCITAKEGLVADFDAGDAAAASAAFNELDSPADTVHSTTSTSNHRPPDAASPLPPPLTSSHFEFKSLCCNFFRTRILFSLVLLTKLQLHRSRPRFFDLRSTLVALIAATLLLSVTADHSSPERGCIFMTSFCG